jgi:hypothetical protein
VTLFLSLFILFKFIHTPFQVSTYQELRLHSRANKFNIEITIHHICNAIRSFITARYLSNARTQDQSYFSITRNGRGRYVSYYHVCELSMSPPPPPPLVSVGLHFLDHALKQSIRAGVASAQFPRWRWREACITRFTAVFLSV